MKQWEENRKAAIVDDEKDLCLLLESMLQREKFNTVSINTLHEIREKVIPMHPDIIFLDNQLPDGSGFRYVPMIRKELPHAKIVMMTAFNTENEKSTALSNGADIFLPKPLTRAVIAKTLETLCIRHSA